MTTNEFTKIMEEHSNDKLLEVLKTRNKFQENAKIAAIAEALKRGLILDENDLDVKFPINNESINLKEKLAEEGFIEFKNKLSKINFILILNIIWFVGVDIITKNDFIISDFWFQITFVLLTCLCYQYYSKLFANIIIWIAAILFIRTAFSIIITIFTLL